MNSLSKRASNGFIKMMFRIEILFTLLIVFVGWSIPQANAVVVVDDFESYNLQTDTSDPFEIRDPGNVIAIAFSESLADSASIVANKHAVFGTSAGSTPNSGVFTGFVGIADFEGPAGPIGQFFSIAQDLTGATISADVRETTGAEETQFRFLVSDTDHEEFVTSKFTLGSNFQNYAVGIGDFTTPLDGGTLDPMNINLFGLEFFTASPSDALALSFGVDNVTINAPQGVPIPLPGAMLLLMSGLAGLVGTALSKQRSL
jgi:hypothetical protein